MSLAIHQKMLGKLEVVFMYMSHFFLTAWPEERQGILFLTDAEGKLLNHVPLGSHPSWKPHTHAFVRGENFALSGDSVIARAIATQSIVTEEDLYNSVEYAWAGFPLLEMGRGVRAVIGLVVPRRVIDFDLASYVKGLEPLLLMGYDAYIKRATSEIVMNASRHDQAKTFVESVIQQVQEIVDKGYCSAAKLDVSGAVLGKDLLTTEPEPLEETSFARLIASIGKRPVEAAYTEDKRTVIAPVYGDGKPLYALFLHLPEEQHGLVYDERDVSFLQNVAEKIRYGLLRVTISDSYRREAEKKELLYELTKKIQASIDVNKVLQEIVSSIERLYPYFSTEVFLTVDTNASIPVKPLVYQQDDSPASRAYMEGTLIMEKREDENETVTVVAAPLLGKQGVYGVLQLTTRENFTLTETETDYIFKLAETAGTAFENAQLYQQSRNLIRELRLINDIAHQLNKSLKLDDVLQFLIRSLLDKFGAEYCAIVKREQGSTCFSVLSSCQPGHVGRTVSQEEPIICELLQKKDAVFRASDEEKRLKFADIAYRSLIAVPLIQEGHVSGFLLVADSRPHFFSYDDCKLLETLAKHTSLAVTNALLHSELERLVITDNLTGLYARRFLDDQVKRSLETDGCGSLILIDIDDFKTVNDTYGHQTGDDVLIQVANLIRQNIRDTDTAARWGGEEMAVYLPRVDINVALSIAERIRNAVEIITHPRVTISVGVAKWEREKNAQVSVEALFHHADVALYEAKRSGKNQIRTA